MRNILLYLFIGLSLVACGDGGSSSSTPLTTKYLFTSEINGDIEDTWSEHRLRSDGYYEQYTIYYSNGSVDSVVLWIGSWANSGGTFNANIAMMKSDGFCSLVLPRSDVFTYSTFQETTIPTTPPESPTLTMCP